MLGISENLLHNVRCSRKLKVVSEECKKLQSFVSRACA